jgi:hypothetical protein
MEGAEEVVGVADLGTALDDSLLGVDAPVEAAPRVEPDEQAETDMLTLTARSTALNGASRRLRITPLMPRILPERPTRSDENSTSARYGIGPSPLARRRKPSGSR